MSEAISRPPKSLTAAASTDLYNKQQSFMFVNVTVLCAEYNAHFKMLQGPSCSVRKAKLFILLSFTFLIGGWFGRRGRGGTQCWSSNIFQLQLWFRTWLMEKASKCKILLPTNAHDSGISQKSVDILQSRNTDFSCIFHCSEEVFVLVLTAAGNLCTHHSTKHTSRHAICPEIF